MNFLKNARAVAAIVCLILGATFTSACSNDNGTPANYTPPTPAFTANATATPADSTALAAPAPTSGVVSKTSATTIITTRTRTVASASTAVTKPARSLNRAQRELARVFEAALGRKLDKDANAAAFNYGGIPTDRAKCMQDVLEKSFRIVTSKEASNRQDSDPRRLAMMLYRALLGRHGESSGIAWHADNIKRFGLAAGAHYMQEGDNREYRNRLATVCT